MRSQTHKRCGLVPLVLLIAFGVMRSPASAQQFNPFFGNQANPVRQVSLSKEADPTADVDPETNSTSPTTQLTVSIRYLLVDDETRRLIYEELNPQSIQRSATAATESDRKDLTIGTQQHQVEKQVTAYGHSATSVVDSLTADAIVQLVDSSATCTMSQAPSVILQQNQTAEVNDIVQRPMMVDIDHESDQFKPVIKVVEEGIRIRLLARLANPSAATGAIDLTAEFVSKTIMDVDSVEVLGLQDKPRTLQRPVCSTTKIVTGEQLVEGQRLLIDPHIQSSATIEVESMSMLGKLPLVGKSFASTESVTVDQHLIVLIKPAVF
jgi:type II secretory pathway component GspD/PulD (secretin)